MSEVISLLVIMSIWTNSFVLLTSYVLDKLNYSMGCFETSQYPFGIRLKQLAYRRTDCFTHTYISLVNTVSLKLTTSKNHN